MLGYYNQLSSEVYDLDKPVGRSFGDVEFYTDRLASCRGKVLEPGVGTGRLLVPLLEKGIAVSGFDASEEMLNICRHHCKEKGLHPTLWEEKMESFSSSEMYEAIIVPTGTFLLLYERETAVQALKNFRRHLSDGGRLILDIFLQADTTVGSTVEKSWETTAGDIITLTSRVVEVDHINQYTVTHNRYEKWRHGKLVQSELERFPVRWFGVEEFRMLLEQTGYTDVIISADYRFRKYPTGADEVITFEASVRKENS
jgi:SAM-dependent methyltransferase